LGDGKTGRCGMEIKPGKFSLAYNEDYMCVSAHTLRNVRLYKFL